MKAYISNNLVQSIISKMRTRRAILRWNSNAGKWELAALNPLLTYILPDRITDSIELPLVNTAHEDSWDPGDFTVRQLKRVLAAWLDLRLSDLVVTDVAGLVAQDGVRLGVLKINVLPSIFINFGLAYPRRALLTDNQEGAWLFGKALSMPFDGILSGFNTNSPQQVGLEFMGQEGAYFSGVKQSELPDAPRCYSHMFCPPLDVKTTYTMQVKDGSGNWQYGCNGQHFYPGARDMPGSVLFNCRIEAGHDEGYQNVTSRSHGYETWWMYRGSGEPHASDIFRPALLHREQSDCTNSYIYAAGTALIDIIAPWIGHALLSIVEGLNHVTQQALQRYMNWSCYDYRVPWLTNPACGMVKAGHLQGVSITNPVDSLPECSKYSQGDLFAVSSSPEYHASGSPTYTYWNNPDKSDASLRAYSFPTYVPDLQNVVLLGAYRRGKKIYSISRGGSRSSIGIASYTSRATGNTRPCPYATYVLPSSTGNHWVMMCGVQVNLNPASRAETRAFKIHNDHRPVTPWISGETGSSGVDPIVGQPTINRRLYHRADSDHPIIDKIYDGVVLIWE